MCVTLPPHTVEGDGETDLRAFTASVQLSLLLSELLRTARSRQPVSLLSIDERLQHVENVHQRAGRIVADLNAQNNAVAGGSQLPFVQQQHQPSGMATPSLDSASLSSSSCHTSRRSSHSTSRDQLLGSLHQLLSSGDSSIASPRAEQANVLVSAAIVRFVATECSIKLHQLRSGGAADERAAAQRIEVAAQETLDVLQSLQHTDALVVNGQILTGKLLYVATALTKRPGGGPSRTLDSLLDCELLVVRGDSESPANRSLIPQISLVSATIHATPDQAKYNLASLNWITRTHRTRTSLSLSLAILLSSRPSPPLACPLCCFSHVCTSPSSLICARLLANLGTRNRIIKLGMSRAILCMA